MKKPTIEDRLYGNGNLIARAKRQMRSLAGADARIILRARHDAMEFYSDATIADFERAGELGMRGHMALPIATEFRGEMEMDFWGLSIRLYNIIGDHPLNHSTVSVVTLVHEGLMPSDMNLFGAIGEYVKVQFIMSVFAVTHVWRSLKEKIGGQS